MSNMIQIAGDRHLETLMRCGGYYSCPKDPTTGKRLGPLVGYAGTYPIDSNDPASNRLQLVGDVYANFAKAEVHSHVLRFFARCLAARLEVAIGSSNIDGLVAAPIGGYSLADALGLGYDDVKIIKAEKKVAALATETSREKPKLVFARHEVERNINYVIVEDVCNNFSTTEELISLIEANGGNVLAIACFLNRSLMVNDTFQPKGENPHIYPVVSVVRQPINEWRQDDPAVAEDIANGNVVLKPKNEWPRLMKAMADSPRE